MMCENQTSFYRTFDTDFINLTQLHHLVDLLDDPVPVPTLLRDPPGGNCIKIGPPGKLILSKRKGLQRRFLLVRCGAFLLYFCCSFT